MLRDVRGRPMAYVALWLRSAVRVAAAFAVVLALFVIAFDMAGMFDPHRCYLWVPR